MRVRIPESGLPRWLDATLNVVLGTLATAPWAVMVVSVSVWIVEACNPESSREAHVLTVMSLVSFYGLTWNVARFLQRRARRRLAALEAATAPASEVAARP